MVMSINHNLMARNTARNLGIHYDSLGTSVRRLSSGLRVGTAADDAAGLAIRELMRADVATLNQGIRNANDAISMIQVADGALQVIDEKLIRMKELATQAATGTYNSSQRIIIDSEFQAMKSEIDRIANATEFNGIKLLQGDLTRIETAAEELASDLLLHLQFNGDIADTSGNGNATSSTGTSFTPGVEGSNALEFNGTNSGLDVDFGIPGDQFTVQLWFNAQSFGGGDERQIFTSSASTSARRYEIQLDPGGRVEVWYSNSITQNRVTTGSAINTDQWYLLTNTYDNGEYKLYLDGTEVISRDTGTGNVEFLADTFFGYDPVEGAAGRPFERFDGLMDDIRIYDKALSPEVIQDYYDVGGNVTLLDDGTPNVSDTIIHFGTGNDAAEDFYSVQIESATASSLGIAESHVQTQDSAQGSIEDIQSAIVTKDKIRANLGATQNRLENTVTNLSIQAENLQAAESRISDVDVATEMTEFVRRQILTQSAVAMLAQANSLPRMAMQLIGGG